MTVKGWSKALQSHNTLEGTATTPASDVGSTSTNRVVTLRASASGHCGYRSQDLSIQSSSLSYDSLAAENSALPSDNIGDMADICETIPAPDLGNDTQPGSNAKPRPKKKNTTTVSYTG